MTSSCKQQYVLRIVMLSDWHTGSGQSQPGGVDALVARDADRLPFIPAKTVHGLWRDACELVARGLDNSTAHGPWSRLVEYLFGSQPARARSTLRRPPRPAALSVRPARYVSTLRSVLSRNEAARRALTFVKPGVCTNRLTGQAEEEFLRCEELARVGSELEADCWLELPEELLQPALALLVAGTKFFTRLGGKRRRGNGHCHVSLHGCNGSAVPTLEEVCKTLATVEPRVPEPDDVGAPAPTILSRRTQPAPTAWWEVPLRLKPLTPIAVTRRAVGNVVETLDYVPGYCLLPHVTHVLKSLGLRDVFTHVAAGRIRVLNATLAINGSRGRPVPFALHARKARPYFARPTEDVFNAFAQEIEVSAKPIRHGYLVWRDPNQVGYDTVPMTIRTHGTVDDESQRPTTEVGGVYAYEAIAPADKHGTPILLHSVLVLAEELHDRLQGVDPNWWQQLNHHLVLGRSKKDDYGWVELTAEPPVACKAPAESGEDDLLSVWVASDVLVRNAQLRYDPTEKTFRGLLERALGVRLEPAPGQFWQFVRVRRHETWHAGWGLPRPSLVGIQAGSCFRYRIVDGRLNPGRLLALQSRGLGERTAEGFGEIVLNHPVLRTKPVDWKCLERSVPPTDPQRLLRPGDPGYKFARLIEREAWKQVIERRVRELAADPDVWRQQLGWSVRGTEVTPTLTQIMAFRQVLQRMGDADDKGRVLGWIKRAQAQRTGHGRTRSGHVGALEKYAALCENEQAIWNLLFEGQNPPAPLTEGADAALKRELWAYALQAFVDACARAIRREVGDGAMGHGGTSHG